MTVFAGALTLAAPANAVTQKLACNQGAIQHALHVGGNWAFGADCTIALTKTETQGAGVVSLDGGSHHVVITAGSRFNGPAFSIRAGNFTLARVTVTQVTNTASSGAAGGNGAGFTNTATGNNGGEGKDAAAGNAVYAAGVSAAAYSKVVLISDTFTNLTAKAGNGGTGGIGGNGDNGAADLYGAAGPGGLGGGGGQGGNGGAAYGGAVYSAGTLSVVGSTFKNDSALAGSGGHGGNAGTGGTGGVQSSSFGGEGGQGGTGGIGGNGGLAGGGGIYASGLLTVRSSSFSDDQAIGGGAGVGGNGGNGGTYGGGMASGGVGGESGSGGNGGSAVGGAVDARTTNALASLSYTNNAVTGAAAGAACPGGAGCTGTPGNGGLGVGGSTAALNGFNGTAGTSGTGTSPDATGARGTLAALRIHSRSLKTATHGRHYSLLLAAGGGIGPYSWRASGLPSGLTLSSAGLISGTPKRAGTYSVTVSVTDPDVARPTTAGTTLALRVH